LKTTRLSNNFSIFSNSTLLSNAAAIGIAIQQSKTSGIANPASMAASGPTMPTIPKPADCGVPLIDNNATGIAEMIAVNKHGNRIIGCLNRLGIMIFIPPSAMAIVTPDLLTFQEYTTSAKAGAATPIADAPAETP